MLLLIHENSAELLVPCSAALLAPFDATLAPLHQEAACAWEEWAVILRRVSVPLELKRN